MGYMVSPLVVPIWVQMKVFGYMVNLLCEVMWSIFKDRPLDHMYFTLRVKILGLEVFLVPSVAGSTSNPVQKFDGQSTRIAMHFFLQIVNNYTTTTSIPSTSVRVSEQRCRVGGGGTGGGGGTTSGGCASNNAAAAAEALDGEMEFFAGETNNGNSEPRANIVIRSSNNNR